MKQEIKLNEEQFKEIKELWEKTNEKLDSIAVSLVKMTEDGIDVQFDDTKPIDLNVNLNGTETALNRISDTLSGRI